MRLDKWLWMARFYKTRVLATQAVNGGKVHLNGERTKPGKFVKIDDELCIRKGSYEYVIKIIQFSKQRGSAKDAQLLYVESEASINARENRRQQLKAVSLSMPITTGKPSKQTRRALIKIKKVI